LLHSEGSRLVRDLDQATAATVVDFGEPLITTSIDIPVLEQGGMLVRVDAATLCGTDVHFWRGAEISASRLPYIPGHESAGTIVAINGTRDDIAGEALRLGERVIWTYPFCRNCFYCSVAQQPTLCTRAVRFGRERADRAPYLLGGCSTHHYVPPGSAVVKIPEEVPSPLAASAACALRTVMHAFERLGALAPDETVLIQGSGPVGLYAVAVAKARGCRRVLVLGAPGDRLAVAESWGADAVLDIEKASELAERRSWVAELTHGRGPDVVFQCVGPAALGEGLDLVRPGGRYVSIGGGGSVPVTVSAGALSTKMLQLIGVVAAEGRHFYQALEFLRAEGSRVDFEKLLSRTYGLAEVTAALGNMESLTDIKPLITPAALTVRNTTTDSKG
jgi:L-iditol 2-dehydrogenase